MDVRNWNQIAESIQLTMAEISRQAKSSEEEPLDFACAILFQVAIITIVLIRVTW